MKTQKNILIVGYGGIGQAIAKHQEAAGNRVIIFEHESVDVTNPDSVAKAAAGLAGMPLDGLVYAAASPLKRRKLMDLTLAEMKEDFEVTVYGFFNVLKAALPMLKACGQASIVAITSSSAEPNQPSTSLGGYVVAKQALRGVLRDAAHELAPFGIRVNAVAPNFVRTKLQEDVPLRMDEFLKEKNPMKQVVTPEDVADVVGWLLSDAARSITGVSVPVTYGEVIAL